MSEPTQGVVDVSYPAEGIGGFRIDARIEEYSLSFVCYECVGLVVGGNPAYPRKGGSCPGDCTNDVADALPFLTGFLKWDGCINLRLNEHDDSGPNDLPLHFCGREDAARIGRLIERLYDLAAELIPAWNGEKPGGQS